MAVMGFCAEKRPVNKSEALPEGEALLRFDSGRAISFLDAQRHTGGFGVSGIGKTTCTAEPALDAAIANIPTILAFDPKGTLAGKVISLAKKHGRLQDLVIIGTTLPAQPINVIEGMAPSQFYHFLMEIFNRFIDGKSHNMDFHASAVSTARDVYQVLKCVSEIARAQPKGSRHGLPKDTAPTLPLILDLLGDCKEATRIFQQYLKIARMTPELRRFAKRIQNSLFHVLNQTKEDGEYDNDHRQQVSYHTGGAVRALTQFLDEPEIIGKLCCPGAPGLDFSRCEGKIILISFGAGAGAAAASVCRLVIESFYAWVYRQGVGGKPKMIIADEYQEYADLSSRRLADPAFLALAREFLCGVFLITQSYAGLVAKHGTAGLDALVPNLNNKIFLHSEDPLTREAARALGSPDLIDLQRECFAVTYDTRTREYVYGVETMNDGYAISCSIQKAEVKPFEQEPIEHPLEDISDAVDWLVDEKKRAYQEAIEKEAESARNPALDDEQVRELHEGTEIDPDDYDQAVGSAEDFVPFWDERREHEKPVQKLDPDDLRVLYSECFDSDADVRIPRGFLPFVGQAFDMMAGLGLGFKLSKLAFSSSKPGLFEAYGQPSGNVHYLNRLLACTRNICARCGAEIEQNAFNLCERCSAKLPKHALAQSRTKKESYHA